MAIKFLQLFLGQKPRDLLALIVIHFLYQTPIGRIEILGLLPTGAAEAAVSSTSLAPSASSTRVAWASFGVGILGLCFECFHRSHLRATDGNDFGRADLFLIFATLLELGHSHY